MFTLKEIINQINTWIYTIRVNWNLEQLLVSFLGMI